jgi:hypothetical protein
MSVRALEPACGSRSFPGSRNNMEITFETLQDAILVVSERIDDLHDDNDDSLALDMYIRRR